MSLKRLLMICGDAPPALSGVGDYTDLLCAELTRLGLDLTLLTTQSPTPTPDQPRPYRVLRNIPSWSFRNCTRAAKFATPFDLVHMQYPSVHYGRGLAVNLIPMMLRARGLPVILTIHDFRVMRSRWRARTVPMLAAASAIIHVDREDERHIRRWSPCRRLRLAHIPIASNTPVLPCDAEQRLIWRRELQLNDDELIVAYFGILYPHKGVAELLDAVAQLRRDGHRIRLLAVGDFDRDADYVAPMTSRLACDSTVWVRGADLNRVSQCLHAADLAALPFHSGASFNRSSMLACLQHGLPTITTDGPATPRNLRDAFDLLLVPPRNPKALADAIRLLLLDPARRRNMRQNALRQTEHLAWPAVARSHLNFYHALLDQPLREAHASAQRA